MIPSTIDYSDKLHGRYLQSACAALAESIVKDFRAQDPVRLLTTVPPDLTKLIGPAPGKAQTMVCYSSILPIRLDWYDMPNEHTRGLTISVLYRSSHVFDGEGYAPVRS